MNTTVRRSVEALTLFRRKLVNVLSLLHLPWSPPSSSEYDRSWSLAAQAINNTRPGQTVLMMMMSNEGTSNGHNHNSFYPRRRVPCAVFSNVNIFNFSLESFSSNLIFAPLILMLLSFLQIQSSGTSPSAFQLRPLAFMVAVGCSVAYYLTLPAKFAFPGFASQFEVLMSVFGSLAVATLTSLTLKLPWWSILFMLVFMGGVFQLLNKLHGVYGNIHRPRPRMMQPLLPLYNDVFNH